MGLVVAIVLGVVLFALLAWWAVFQSSWFGPAPAASTSITVTENQPPPAATA